MKFRKSLSTKIILMVGTILLFSSAVFCLVSISRARVGIRQAIQQRMVDIANCAAGSVNGDILKSLKAGDEGTPGYKTVYDSMAVFRDNAELEYVYAIRDEGDGRFTFIVDTDPDEPGAFGDEVHYTEALERASKGTTAVDEVPYSDSWGSFYSAYSPVFGSDGRVAGIVATDFTESWFDAQLQQQTMSSVRSCIAILFVMLLASTVLCLLIVRPYVRMQEQLLEEKVSAESANQAKSDFLANMSHEIRTPINAVLGMNEMILRESRQGRELPAGQGEEVRKSFDQIGNYAREVEGAGRSLLTIVNDILDFSKIEAGRMELVKGRYRLGDLLDQVTGMVLIKAREKGLRFTLNTEEPLPENLFGDERRIREILMNILNNAVKYTEQGFVRFTVRAGAQENSTVRMIFSVEDSGIGIRQKDMYKLFTKFQRLDMERNSTVEGSGLGLVITRSLLDMMGGTISVESEYGKGSVFTVVIPQLIVEADPAGEALKQEPESRKTADYRGTLYAPDARVLVVDDTKMNLMVSVSLLKGTGIRVDTALSGAEAITLAQKNAYDVIFMDQRMPEMDGTETLRRIRQAEDSPNGRTPVICLTADAVVGARERYLAEGFSDYLAKPVNGGKLEAMLAKYLPAGKIVTAADEKANGPEEDETAVPEDGDEYALLREAGIDPDTGLHYCQGDGELYRSLLADYCLEYPEKSAAVRRTFRVQDWKNYGIYVHALKSSSRMLGAGDLSAAAARLEAAANSGDGDTIRNEHEKMLAGYEIVAGAIRSFAGTPEAEVDPEAGVFEFEPDEKGQDPER